MSVTHLVRASARLTALIKAILCLKKPKQCKMFLADIMTAEELIQIANRWAVALMLDDGITEELIRKKLKVGSATVSRVNHWLNHGEGGYRFVLRKVNKAKGRKGCTPGRFERPAGRRERG